jgi:hypothetical protein
LRDGFNVGQRSFQFAHAHVAMPQKHRLRTSRNSSEASNGCILFLQGLASHCFYILGMVVDGGESVESFGEFCPKEMMIFV